MKRRTTDLEGDELDLAVAIARGFSFVRGMPDTEEAVLEKCRNAPWRHNPSGSWSCMRCCEFDNFSRDWAVGGPVYAEMKCLQEDDVVDGGYHTAGSGKDFNHPFVAKGPTKLISAMRCFVGMTLGDEVDLPEGII